MVKNLLIVLVLLFTANMAVIAQQGALKGKILDKSNKEPIPFASIIVENNGTQAGGTTSDINGEYTIKPLNPGTYSVKATFVGYKPVLIRGLVIHSEKIEFQNIEMEPTATELQTYEVIDYKVPLISKDNTASGQSITAEEIAKMPQRNVNAVTASVAGVFSRDGEIGSMRGQRSEGNVMYIDGIRVRGTSSLPESAIEQVSVILGGLPAQYGDATGGVINVTTKGPSRTFGGGLELQTSEGLDHFGYNRAGINLTGPIFWNKDKTYSILGYFAAVDFEYKKDGSPLALGMYKVKDDVLAELEKNPLRVSTTGFGTVQNAEYIHANDIEKLNSNLNDNEFNVNSSIKFDIKTGKNTNLTIGGSYNSYNTHDFNWTSSLFNYDRNSISDGKTYRVFGRFTQRFPVDKESASLIKNVYYSIQGDYTNIYQRSQDADLKDNLFAYGYVGKFTTYKSKIYENVEDTNSAAGFRRELQLFGDTLVTFQREEYNPIMANYTSNYYDLFADDPSFRFRNTDMLLAGGALLSGFTPSNTRGGVFGLWSAPGDPQSGYGVSGQEQVTANLNLSADIGNHEIKLGFSFEKYTLSSYGYSPVNFWSIMRQFTNSHIEQLDKANPINYTTPLNDSVDVSVTDYYRLYDAASQRTFDRNLRTLMGLAKDGTDWIDINSYDIDAQTINYYDKNNVMRTVNLSKPLSVDLFGAEDLLNGGYPVASARGYDYYGNKFSRNYRPSMADYFNKTNSEGDLTREVAPFEPIYMAGYIQDKFAFDDLVFNVGLRFDRFDANQSVLKDPYSLYPAKTVAEVKKEGIDLGNIPTSMGDDYIVYINDINNPSAIMGYRSGSTWFDANGSVVQDPSIKLNAGNGVIPYLQDRTDPKITEESFVDYNPQWSVMPRISFSFPISDVALFYAHYDVLTQRPKTAAEANPVQYLQWQKNVIGTNSINNPNLKPEKTVDYELGFQQKVSNTSSINISGFYREFRDQIQSFRFTGAYPLGYYYSFNNIDFGTVKGLSISYDLRRTTNIRVRASYTLQFANGTGSDASTAKGLILSGQPNLRTLIPYDYDQRHQFKLDVDFRYAEGKDYNGPIIAGKQILKNAGFNITLDGGSGTPYTRSSKVYKLGNQRQIAGSINGSRLPAFFRFDGRVDKDFTVATKKDSKGNAREIYLNVYLQVLNILNTRNVQAVYAATGNPDDDGYLAAAEWQSEIQAWDDTQAFIDLYKIRVNNPYFYSSPRMIRLGIGINF
ncbi:MAG: TonB-dependent receptor [Bacteroidetes bacterium]|nr:TonB-dependent receptor [Bacteroidota bacterium]